MRAGAVAALLPRADHGDPMAAPLQPALQAVDGQGHAVDFGRPGFSDDGVVHRMLRFYPEWPRAVSPICPYGDRPVTMPPGFRRLTSAAAPASRRSADRHR